MGIFTTRINREEKHVQHKETYKTDVTHKRASVEDVHSELRKFKSESRNVLDREMEVENTILSRSEVMAHVRPEDWSIFVHAKFTINDNEVVMGEKVRETELVDRIYNNNRDTTDLIWDFIEKRLPKHVLNAGNKPIKLVRKTDPNSFETTEVYE